MKIREHKLEQKLPVILMATSSGKSRAWMLTINNPTDGDVQTLVEDSHEYLVFQFEVGQSGTLHIQAFIYYKNPRVWPKKRYPNAHIEPCKNITASIRYCKKEESRYPEGGGPFEYGQMPEQGRRTDLEEIAKRVINGGNMAEIANDHPDQYVKYARGLQMLKTITMKDRTVKPTVTWIWGKTGVGKTRFVYDNHKEIYMKDGTHWWDGYDQQEVILIDDFDGRWPYRDLLRLLDYYPYQGQTKGGYVRINSPFIYITCEYPPSEIWLQSNEVAQMERRMEQIIHME